MTTCTYGTPIARPLQEGSRDSLPSELARDPSFSPTERLVLLVLAGHAWGARETCWPSNTTIARATGRSVGHARRILAVLVARGVIRKRPADNQTGREFILSWKATGPRAGGARLDTATPPAPARTESSESKTVQFAARSDPDEDPEVVDAALAEFRRRFNLPR